MLEHVVAHLQENAISGQGHGPLTSELAAPGGEHDADEADHEVGKPGGVVAGDELPNRDHDQQRLDIERDRKDDHRGQ